MTRKKVVILTGTLIVLTCAVVATVLLYNKHKNDPEDTAYKNLQTVTIPDDANKTQKVLLFTFEVGNSVDSMQLKSIDQYNSHADIPNTRENQYNFSVTEEGNPVYLSYFDIPITTVEDFSEQGKIKTVDIVKEKKLAFKTPRFTDGAVFTIRNKTGKVLVRDTIKNVSIEEKEAMLKTIRGLQNP